MTYQSKPTEKQDSPRPLDTLLLNVLLGLAWVALTGDFSPENFVGGLVLGYLAVRLLYRGRTGQTYLLSVRKLIGFIAFFTWQVIKANVSMLITVIAATFSRRTKRMRPAVIAIPLDIERDLSITLLANVITLTPGTLTLDVSDDKHVLYVHTVYVPEDIEAFRREIKNGFEKRIKDLLE